MSALLLMLRPFLLPIAAVLIGFGAGVAWEHRGVQTFPLSLTGDSLRVQRDEALSDVAHWKGQASGWNAAYEAWRAANGRCEAARAKEALKASEAVTAASERRIGAQSDAFNNGYSAGRVAGRKTCGVPDAKPDPHPARPAVGGVQPAGQADPIFGGDGAYRPGD